MFVVLGLLFTVYRCLTTRSVNSKPEANQMYTLKRSVVVETSLEQAWDFIRRPQNLNLITPGDMEFVIVSDVPKDMYDGLLVECQVKIPFLGTKRWLSEIKYVRDHHSFVDEQRIGPYKLWYHYHEIEAVAKGVRFIDKVVYEVPFSFLGRMAHGLFIKRTLDRIFDYRNERYSILLEGKTH